MNTIHFNPTKINSKIRNLESNGFKVYLDTFEDGINHIIMTNTKPGHFYNGIVCDLYSDGRLEYSTQFKNQEQQLPQIIQNLKP